MFYLAGYLAAVNLLAFLLFGIDKQRAKRGKWRISEASLMGAAVLGGSVGAWVGMKIFRHKTKHRKFAWGIPVLLFCQILAGIWILRGI